MGSNIMHLVISKKIQENYRFSEAFLIGAILPDLYKRLPTYSREMTHYAKTIIINDDIYKIIQIEKYINEQLPHLKEYKKKLNEDEYIKYKEIFLGYLVHLIEDSVWEEIFQLKYRKKARALSENFDEYFPKMMGHIYDEYSYADKQLLDLINYDEEKLENLKKKMQSFLKANNNILISNDEIIKLIDSEVYIHEMKSNLKIEFITPEDVESFYALAVKKAIEYIDKYDTIDK